LKIEVLLDKVGQILDRMEEIKPPECMWSEVFIKLGTRLLACIISLEIQYPTFTQV